VGHNRLSGIGCRADKPLGLVTAVVTMSAGWGNLFGEQLQATGPLEKLVTKRLQKFRQIVSACAVSAEVVELAVAWDSESTRQWGMAGNCGCGRGFALVCCYCRPLMLVGPERANLVHPPQWCAVERSKCAEAGAGRGLSDGNALSMGPSERPQARKWFDRGQVLCGGVRFQGSRASPVRGAAHQWVRTAHHNQGAQV
jgi:hypothetical protein